MSDRILVAGGGIGGLCLAQGLVKAGKDVTVFERAASARAFADGYRIHIDPDGSRALRECLPAERFALFEAACGRAPRSFAFLTDQLSEVLFADVGDAEHRSVNRFTLRQILLEGLDVRFGKEVTGYRSGAEVSVSFADSGSASGAVLVGAEGTRSAVREQLLPGAHPIETGVGAIAGRIPLDAGIRKLLPDRLATGPVVIMAPGGLGMFLAVHEGVTAELPDHLLPPERGDYLVWSVGGAQARLATASARELTRRWHPQLRGIVEASDPATIRRLTIKTSVAVPAWPSSNVTLLGDAIHSMPPSRGVGANTALRDARLLSRTLVEVGPSGIAAYEREMREYGFAAVKASMRAMRQQGTANPVGFAVVKGLLRLLNAMPAVKNRMFAA